MIPKFIFARSLALVSSFEGELIPSDATGADNMGDLLAVSSAGSFLPRLQLYGGNSEACKEQKIGIGCFGLVRDKDRIENLTNEVELLVICGRAKAMQIDGDTIITNYDRTSEVFSKIAQESETPDSGCMYGPEFLVWVPAANSFATFFMSSKTARREAPAFAARMGKAASMTSKLIKGKKFSWHGPVVSPCDHPTFEVPPLEEIKKQAAAFSNPTSSGVEKVDAGSNERER